MMRALLDVDGVLADFPSGVQAFCNQYGRTKGSPSFSLETAKEHDLLKAWDIEHMQKRLDQHMIDTDFARHMPVYPGAQDFVESLKSVADVIIVTARYRAVPTWTHAREAWLVEHFEIDPGNIVFAKRKELVAGNFLLDDKLRNIDAWRNAWGHQGAAVVFDRPWNQGIQLRTSTYDGAIEIAREVKRKLEAGIK
jgi:5'(3')-deoxyribonucleotidase